MRNHAEGTPNAWREFLLAIAAVMALAVPVVVGALTVPRLQAQAPAGTADRPVFDVASVKPNKSGTNMVRFGGPQTGGRYTATNVTLNMLVTSAYKLKPHQISGLPNWDNSEHFDIEAKAEGNPSRDQINLMVQSLLADRFKLVVHRETRQLPIYALVLSKAEKTGARLQPHSDDTKCPDLSSGPPPPPRPDGALPPAPCGGFFMSGSPGGFRMAGQKIAMDQLAQNLSNFVDRIVVDRTGLTGAFDLSLDFMPTQMPAGFVRGPDSNASDPSAPPTIFTALQEQLGLKLEAQTGPVDVLIVDHVEQPSEN